MRRSFVAATIFAVLLGGVAFAGSADASCYPGPCSGPDARLAAISVQREVFVHSQAQLVVAGRNIGDKGSRVRARTRTNNGVTSPPQEIKGVRAGQRFRFYFTWTPDRTGQATISACTKAIPLDVDHSNDCGHVFHNVRPLR